MRKSAAHWHKIIGYIGLEAVKYLQNTTESIKIQDLKSTPKIINYKECSILKAKQIISQSFEHKEPAIKPFKPPIIENPPYNIDSEDGEVIEPTENIQRNQPNAGLSEGVEK